jgi:hypothetical protein
MDGSKAKLIHSLLASVKIVGKGRHIVFSKNVKKRLKDWRILIEM